MRMPFTGLCDFLMQSTIFCRGGLLMSLNKQWKLFVDVSAEFSVILVMLVLFVNIYLLFLRSLEGGWLQFSGHYHYHLKVMTVNYFVPVVNSRLSSLNIQKCHEILFLVLECNALLYNIFYLSLDRFWEFFVPSCANWLLYNSILNWLWLADIICYI